MYVSRTRLIADNRHLAKYIMAAERREQHSSGFSANNGYIHFAFINDEDAIARVPLMAQRFAILETEVGARKGKQLETGCVEGREDGDTSEDRDRVFIFHFTTRSPLQPLSDHHLMSAWQERRRQALDRLPVPLPGRLDNRRLLRA